MELVTQECLDRYPLEFIDYEGQGTDVTVEGTRFTIGSATGYYFPTFRLPAGVTCENCVLQWYWTTGKRTIIYVFKIRRRTLMVKHNDLHLVFLNF